MSIYAKFTLEQLGEAYKYHSQQDCVVSKRMAQEILREIAFRKGQRAAKIRRTLGVKTVAEDDCEPLYIIWP